MSTVTAGKASMKHTLIPLLYSKKDAAFLLSVSLRTVDTLLITKELKPVRIGSRVLISADELRMFCKRGSPELN